MKYRHRKADIIIVSAVAVILLLDPEEYALSRGGNPGH
jgi:hypothetical protein